jgi:cation/acetate symporter
VLLIAILLPVTIIAGGEYNFPVAPLTFGFAARDAGLLAIAAGRDLAPSLPGQFLGPMPQGAAAAFWTVVAVAGGVAVLPHLAMRGATVRGAHRARVSAAWMALLVVLVALAAPAYAAFARLVILRDIADTFLGDVPDWLFTLGHLGLAKACGVAPLAVDMLAAACRAQPGFDGTLHADQIALGRDAVTIFGPSILGLPFAFTALVAAGGLAAALAAAGAMAFAIASAIGHDFVGGVVGTRVTGGRQLILTRLVLVAVVIVALWFANAGPRDVFLLAPLAISLSAGALLPALAIGIWWKRANAGGALAGIILGGVVTLTIALAALYPNAAIFVLFGLPHLGLGVLTASLVGMPLGAAAVVLGSLATAEPSEHEEMLVDAIRRPGGPPIVQENESL